MTTRVGARSGAGLAVTLVLTLALAACQAQSGGASPSAAEGPPGGIQSTLTGTLAASGSVGASPTATLTQVRAAGCTTTMNGNQTSLPVVTPRTPFVGIDPALQGRLGAYGAGRLLVLAPVGWDCFAIDSTNSSALITSPDGLGEVALNISTTAVLSDFEACSFFASALSALRLHASQPCLNDSEPSDQQLHALSPDLVSVTDPHGGEPFVLGPDQPGYATVGLVWFDAAKETTSEIMCTVAPADEDLCAPILANFRATLPAPAPGATPAELPSFPPTVTPAPTPTPAPTRPPKPLGDCAVRLNQANATVIIRGAGPTACTAAKHSLLGIGVFVTIAPSTASKGLDLICSGGVSGLSSNVEVWDSGGAIWATMICQSWNLVSP